MEEIDFVLFHISLNGVGDRTGVIENVTTKCLLLWILNLLLFLAEEEVLKTCCWYITYKSFSFPVVFGDDDCRPPVH